MQEKNANFDTFPGRMQFAMQKRDLKAKDVVLRTGLSSGYVSQLLNGKRQGKGIGLCKELASVFSCSANWLATGIGDPGFEDTTSPTTTVTVLPSKEPAQEVTEEEANEMRQKLEQTKNMMRTFLSMVPIEQVFQIARDAIKDKHVELAQMAIDEAEKRGIKSGD